MAKCAPSVPRSVIRKLIASADPDMNARAIPTEPINYGLSSDRQCHEQRSIPATARATVSEDSRGRIGH